jgi:hypothetical protein
MSGMRVSFNFAGPRLPVPLLARRLALWGALWGALGVLGGAALLPAAAMARPALWLLWQNQVTGQYLCRQTAPGDAWVALPRGPFKDSRCLVLSDRAPGQ